jgi:CheY-like chemotaxis protein
MKEDLLPLKDAARVLGVTTRTHHRWVLAGEIRPVTIEGEPFFHPDDVSALFEKNESSPASRRKRILIIDDDPLVGDSLKNLLEKSGFEASSVTLGLAALDTVLKDNFDLIIADVRMPGMNGIETLRAIRDLQTQFQRPPLPEIILTAYDDPKVKAEADRMGVRAFILKPFDIGHVTSALKKILEPEGQKKPVRA